MMLLILVGFFFHGKILFYCVFCISQSDIDKGQVKKKKTQKLKKFWYNWKLYFYFSL